MAQRAKTTHAGGKPRKGGGKYLGKIRPPKERKYGKGSRKCRMCGTHEALIRKYGLHA